MRWCARLAKLWWCRARRCTGRCLCSLMAMGEGGKVFAQSGQYSGQIVAFDLGSGTVSWTYSMAQILDATQGGGVTLTDNNNLISFDGSGQSHVLSTTFSLWTIEHFAAST